MADRSSDDRERILSLEQRIGELTEQRDVWRRRADERKRQLDRKRWLPTNPFRSARTPVAPQPEAPPPALVHPSIRVAVLASSAGVRAVAGVARSLDITGKLPAADLVVIETSELDRMDAEDRSVLLAELGKQGSPPVVEVGGDQVADARLRIGPDELDLFEPRPLTQQAPTRLVDAGAVRLRRDAMANRAPERHLERWLVECGVSFRPSGPHVTGLLVTMRPDEAPGAIERFRAQSYDDSSLVVVAHRFDDADWNALAGGHAMDGVTLLRRDESVTLGECLNDAAAVANGNILAKWDDDDYYGPSYLEDSVHALRCSGSDIVVRATQFTYIESGDAILLRRPGAEEVPFTGAASGGSFVIRRRVWEDAPFAHRHRAIDVLFLESARAAGYDVFSTHRFGFAYRRRVSGATWSVSDDLMQSQGDRVFDGAPDERLDA